MAHDGRSGRRVFDRWPRDHTTTVDPLFNVVSEPPMALAGAPPAVCDERDEVPPDGRWGQMRAEQTVTLELLKSHRSGRRSQRLLPLRQGISTTLHLTKFLDHHAHIHHAATISSLKSSVNEFLVGLPLYRWQYVARVRAPVTSRAGAPDSDQICCRNRRYQIEIGVKAAASADVPH
jgi:hypothetical protein